LVTGQSICTAPTVTGKWYVEETSDTTRPATSTFTVARRTALRMLSRTSLRSISLTAIAEPSASATVRDSPMFRSATRTKGVTCGTAGSANTADEDNTLKKTMPASSDNERLRPNPMGHLTS